MISLNHRSPRGCVCTKPGASFLFIRASAIQDVIKFIKAEGKDVLIYEPALNAPEFNGCPVTSDLTSFKETSSIIVANRLTDDLKDIKQKVYTRDLFSRD